MKSLCRSFVALLILCVLILQSFAIVVEKRRTILTAPVTAAPVVSNDVVISQVYGAGGNAGATLRNDYVELFNRGANTVSLAGWSVQYASATGTGSFSANITPLSGSIAPGQYYLVQESSGGANGTTLPTADATGTIAMAAGAGKVIVANVATGVACNGGSTPCAPADLAQIVDLVGYGNANFFEGAAAAPTLTATTSAFRASGGCTDTDNNGADFASGTPAARNTATTPAPCSGSTNPSGVGAANPSTVAAGGNTLLTVTVTNGTNPTSTGVTVTGNLSTIGGSATQQFFDNGTNGDTTAGDNVFSFGATVAAATTAGLKTLPTTITDAQARNGSANISVTVTSSSTSPSGTGSANPSTVTAGGTSLLTVAVVPGSNPTSTGLTVTADLTTIGGSATQTLFDDGTNGDTTPADNTFSYSATVAAATTGGLKNLPVTIADAQARTGNTNISLTVNAATPTGQPLPFSQNWTNTGLITTNNVWSGVPGIVGYLGDYSTGTDTGVDPQTLVSDFSNTTVSVLANQTDPNGLISGGVAEFEIADPVVAFQGSGTADAPHIVISVNTTGASNITVSYTLRDVDSSADNSVQPVALQYRIGASGNYTNVPSAFVADASDGPSTATRVTPVGVVLPAEANNQSLVQLRIITTNALGSDEWIGIDNIRVEANGTIPLSAVGAASPSNVEAGTQARLTVTVNPATNPTSSGITVAGDLTSIGGNATQAFFDDGTNGDVTPGDNIFTYQAAIPVNTASGAKVLPITIGDAQARTANTSIGLTVSGATDPQEHLVMGNPSNAITDVNNPTNYLLAKSQYVMSYNRDRGIPNWVSWHLDSSWIGDAPRQDDFRNDPSLPAGWYQVQNTDYSGSGFDRGHHTPSADRTRSIPDNSATFFMTNMMPQAPFNNQGPWEELESYCRTLVSQGNELYIIAGGAGTGGSGSNGGTTNTIANGHVTVPAVTWKVILVLPNGTNDVDRVFKTTRMIAVIMPNNQSIGINTPWRNFRTSVRRVEALTGLNFFSNVRPQMQNVLEKQIDQQ